MKKLVLSIALLCLCVILFSENDADPAVAYIRQYSSIAVSEMSRSGIPASITLAQGMLESSNGMGTLARESNNHFGIKCHSDWTGEHVFHDDDAKGECFRKYPQVSDSYRDHSDFLRFKPRYASLFELEITDYKSWAFGLKAAGYATDPRYAYKLVGLIEKYDLARFDVMDSTLASAIPSTPLQLETPVRTVSKGKDGIFAVSMSREMLQLNNVPFVYARAGESYRSIAHQYDLFPNELASFNDDKNPDRSLKQGETVYLQRKCSAAAKGLDKHVCEGGETLLGISQKYAVRVKSLLKYNSGIMDVNLPLPEDCTVKLRAK